MAKLTIEGVQEYAVKLSRLADTKKQEEIAKKAIYKAAGIITDEIKKGINGIPVDKNRYLRGGDQLNVVTETQKNDLLKSLGITPIRKDKDGNWNAKVGFDGYGSIKTKKYPKGLPNELLMRATESGSSVRKKYPVTRKAINKKRKESVKAMSEIIDEGIKEIME